MLIIILDARGNLSRAIILFDAVLKKLNDCTILAHLQYIRTISIKPGLLSKIPCREN